ncbi:MAG: hypothetical protein IJ584_04300 [Bacteroidales bacterium]|nr:hypothetical protein [Bacteroidales bacterium]
MGIEKFFSGIQEETERMASTVDKVFDETGKALDGIDVSHLSADDESALESKIEEKVSATMKEAEASKESLLDKLKVKFWTLLG